jgi:MFS family permease
MVGAVAGVWALLLGMALLMVGNGLQGSLLGVRASLEGFPTTVTGVLMSGYYVGFLAGSTLAPKLVARVGHVRVFGALAALASTAILVHALLVLPIPWGLMRLLSGFCYAGLYVVAESWLNNQASNQTRGQLLSVYMVVSVGGMGLGQGLLNVADPAGAKLFMLVAILVSLAVVPMLLSARPAPPFAALAKVDTRLLYRASPLGVVGMFGTVMAHGAFFGMGAVYGHAAGLSVPAISLLIGLWLAGGVLLQWPIGRLSDAFDRRGVLTAVTFAAALLALVAPLQVGRSELGLLVVVALYGGLALPMYSLCIAHTNDFLRPEQMVQASGTLVLVGGIGASLGPVSAALMMVGIGPAGFFWWLAAIHAAIGLFAIWRMTRREALPVAEQGTHVPFPPRATPTASALCAEAAEGVAADAEATPVEQPIARAG